MLGKKAVVSGVYADKIREFSEKEFLFLEAVAI